MSSPNTHCTRCGERYANCPCPLLKVFCTGCSQHYTLCVCSIPHPLDECPPVPPLERAIDRATEPELFEQICKDRFDYLETVSKFRRRQRESSPTVPDEVFRTPTASELDPTDWKTPTNKKRNVPPSKQQRVTTKFPSTTQRHQNGNPYSIQGSQNRKYSRPPLIKLPQRKLPPQPSVQISTLEKTTHQGSQNCKNSRTPVIQLPQRRLPPQPSSQQFSSDAIKTSNSNQQQAQSQPSGMPISSSSPDGPIITPSKHNQQQRALPPQNPQSSPSSGRPTTVMRSHDQSQVTSPQSLTTTTVPCATSLDQEQFSKNLQAEQFSQSTIELSNPFQILSPEEPLDLDSLNSPCNSPAFSSLHSPNSSATVIDPQGHFLSYILPLIDELAEELRQLEDVPLGKMGSLLRLTSSIRSAVTHTSHEQEQQQTQLTDLRQLSEQLQDQLVELKKISDTWLSSASNDLPLPQTTDMRVATYKQPDLLPADDQGVILLQPKTSTLSFEEIRNHLRQLDQLKDKITDVRTTRDGSMLLQCATNEEINHLHTNLLQHPLSQSLKISFKGPRQQHIILFNLSKDTTRDQIIKSLLNRLPTLLSTDITFIRVISGKQTTFHQVIALPTNQASLLLPRYKDSARLLVNLTSCLVKRYFRVLRCFHCQGFGHFAARCPTAHQSPTCTTCAQGHKTCPETAPPLQCCANCLHSNAIHLTTFDTRHPTYSKLCSVYQQELQRIQDYRALNDSGMQ